MVEYIGKRIITVPKRRYTDDLKLKERVAVMKKIIMTVILLIFLSAVTGCSGKDNANEAGQKNTGIADNKGEEEAAPVSSGKVSETQNGDEAKEDSDQEKINLLVLSEELALEMVNGDFDRTYETMSLIVKAQMSKNDLKTAWDATVKGLGKYVQVYETTEESKDSYRIVTVLLEYENNGLKISFTYNTSDKMDGLWFSYATVGMDLETTDTYTEQAITIGEGSYPVDGILTLPQGIEKPPVVILVHGSGTHDWDETVGANKPFRDIAHGLAEQGIASIRYQERLAKYPELATSDVTIREDSLDDADQAIKYAAAYDKLDTSRIFVIGHSLGGMLAPEIAAKHEEVKGIICLAGSPRRLEDIIVDQQELLIGLSEDYTESQKEEILDLTKEQAEQVKGVTEEDKGTYLGITAPYWYSLNQIDTPDIVTALDIPMLICQGSADWQVYADKDYTAWQELLKGKDNVTFHLYENLNHLFMESTGKVDVDEYNTPGTVRQQVIDDMAAWINEY